MAEGIENLTENRHLSHNSNTSQPTWSSSVLCRYYLHGVCTKADNCCYSHDLGSAPQDNVCKYYLKGACGYGNKCRYDHVKPKPPDHLRGGQRSPDHQRRGQRSDGIKSQPTHNSVPQSNKKSLSSPPLPSNWSTPKPMNLPREPDPHLGSGMVKLKKGQQMSSARTPKKSIDEWAQAAEFVPGQLWQGSTPTSYLNAVQSGLEHLDISHQHTPVINTDTSSPEMCPYAVHGACPYGDACTYLHGNLCDICGRAVLVPGDEEQNKTHQKECVSVLEEDMEESFAFQRSKDKVCGVCMETVMEKKPQAQQRFGILSNCNHVFCLACIRKWRQAKSFENKIVRSCPECRVKSDFVTPSQYWADDPVEKEKLIQGYKQALSQKPCKHFDQGRGECPFNAHCFYRHAYPDGRIASPKPIRRRRRADNDGNMVLLERIFLWDFLHERNNRGIASLEEDLEDIFIQLSLMHSLDSGDDTDFEFTDDDEDEEESLHFLT